MSLNANFSTQEKIEYLRTLPAIRERCGRVHDLAKQGKLQYFEYHPDKETDAADYCSKIIKVCLTCVRPRTTSEYFLQRDFADVSLVCRAILSGKHDVA